MRDLVLTPPERSFLDRARRAVLATIAPDGQPRLVPICFVLDRRVAVLYTPLDEKPKSVDDVARLARVTDIGRDPRVSVLVDRWDEDWTRLGWLRCHGTASILEPVRDDAERGPAIAALRSKYPPYAGQRLEALPMIRIAIQRTSHWGALDDG